MQQFTHRFLLVSWLLISTGCLFAQQTKPDVLHRLDRTTQNVRVKEVTDVEVFYTESNAPTTVRKIRKVELWKVVYGDGTSDVYNEPKASKPAVGPPTSKPAVTSTPSTRPTTPTSKPAVTSPSTRPAAPASKPAVASTPAATPAPAASPVAEMPQPAPAKTSQPADLGTFLAGRQALSVGVDLAGLYTTNTNNRGSTTTTTKTANNNIALTVLYQQFKSDNVSMGGGLSVGLIRSKSSNSSGDYVKTTPFVTLSGLTRRYLPVASNVAFYGFGSAELNLRWNKSKSPSISETTSTEQHVSLQGGAGLTYLFNPGFSIDFNASLLGLTIDRTKSKSPGSKADVDLSVTGAGVVPAFSLFLTRYF